MKLFHLFLLPRATREEWDTMDACIVRAVDESAARETAARNRGQEGRAVWLDPSKTKCTELTVEGFPGMILRDYNAG